MAPPGSTRTAAEAPRSGRPHPPNGGVNHPRPVGCKLRACCPGSGDPRATRDAAARTPRQLPHGGQRARAAAPARDHELLGDVGAGGLAAGRPLHADRARPARPRRLGHAARRLLARRPRQRGARRRQRTRPRARDGRRALARRRDRDAVRLPVPRAHRAPGAGLQRRARPRGPSAAARRVAARRRLRAARADLAAAGRARPRDRRAARPRRPRSRRATSGSSRAASPRSTTRARARRSCTRCGP